MKTPAEISVKLRSQWTRADKREPRLLGGAGAWPVAEAIGLPKPIQISTNLDAVKRHIQQWRNVTIGEVNWREVSYRATAEPVSVPESWQLNKPTEWIAACADNTIYAEFQQLGVLVENADKCFHPLLVRRFSLWREKPQQEVVQACRLASILKPGCAEGKPLRALSLNGIDTKFFERNATLITALLDVRYDGEVSRLGLEPFLNAHVDGDHWVLLVDLDGSLLPFKKQRITTDELGTTTLPGRRLLIVENESCLHHIPLLKDTLVVLGAGFDLGWTTNPSLQNKVIAYWGDIDTWGLNYLSAARANLPALTPLMMRKEIYFRYQNSAVAEPVVAGTDIPSKLTHAEAVLYHVLLNSRNGRLEQEFLPLEFSTNEISHWAEETAPVRSGD